MTALLEYLDLSISAGRAQLRFGGPSPVLGYTNEKQAWCLKALLKFRGMLLYNMPIMPALCPKLAYYASIMLDALACLLCLKLCRHNRRRPRSIEMNSTVSFSSAPFSISFVFFPIFTVIIFILLFLFCCTLSIYVIRCTNGL